MITIDNKEYHGVTTIFDPLNPPRNLVTYTVDGEPSAPLYTEHGSSDYDLADYLIASEIGQVRNLRMWKLDTIENAVGESILGQFR